MPKKRDPESDEHRSERAVRQAKERIRQSAAEDQALDAAVRRSIRQHGP